MENTHKTSISNKEFEKRLKEVFAGSWNRYLMKFRTATEDERKKLVKIFDLCGNKIDKLERNKPVKATQPSSRKKGKTEEEISMEFKYNNISGDVTASIKKGGEVSKENTPEMTFEKFKKSPHSKKNPLQLKSYQEQLDLLSEISKKSKEGNFETLCEFIEENAKKTIHTAILKKYLFSASTKLYSEIDERQIEIDKRQIEIDKRQIEIDKRQINKDRFENKQKQKDKKKEQEAYATKIKKELTEHINKIKKTKTRAMYGKSIDTIDIINGRNTYQSEEFKKVLINFMLYVKQIFPLSTEYSNIFAALGYKGDFTDLTESEARKILEDKIQIEERADYGTNVKILFDQKFLQDLKSDKTELEVDSGNNFSLMIQQCFSEKKFFRKGDKIYIGRPYGDTSKLLGIADEEHANKHLLDNLLILSGEHHAKKNGSTRKTPSTSNSSTIESKFSSIILHSYQDAVLDFSQEIYDLTANSMYYSKLASNYIVSFSNTFAHMLLENTKHATKFIEYYLEEQQKIPKGAEGGAEAFTAISSKKEDNAEVIYSQDDPSYEIHTDSQEEIYKSNKELLETFGLVKQ